MITRLGQDSRNYNKTYSTLKNDDKKTQNPSFKSSAVFLPILHLKKKRCILACTSQHAYHGVPNEYKHKMHRVTREYTAQKNVPLG